MKLLLDEMFPPAAAEQLRARGHDVVAVIERHGLPGTEDRDLFELAQDEHRAIVTENVPDFMRLARTFHRVPSRKGGGGRDGGHPQWVRARVAFGQCVAGTEPRGRPSARPDPPLQQVPGEKSGLHRAWREAGRQHHGLVLAPKSHGPSHRLVGWFVRALDRLLADHPGTEATSPITWLR